MNIDIVKAGIVREVDFVAIVFQDKDGITYFQIQDSYEYDSQDVSLGMDKYYIELNDQSFASYGGIEKIQKDQTALRICLDVNGKTKLKTDEVNMKIDTITFNEIESEIINMCNKHQISFEKS